MQKKETPDTRYTSDSESESYKMRQYSQAQVGFVGESTVSAKKEAIVLDTILEHNASFVMEQG